MKKQEKNPLLKKQSNPQSKNKGEIRIQKLISNYGSYSRREVERLIISNRIKKNGSIVKLGDLATINDRLEIDGKKINLNLKHDYYILNKPKGYICSKNDERGKEVISLINNYRDRNLFTVGRLDVSTTGLIIITNDGTLANLISSPKNKIKKVYLAWIKNPLSKIDIKNLSTGVKLDDGYITKPAKIKIIDNNTKPLIKLTITEGKKNQIKRMFLGLDNEVLNLKRVQIGDLKLDGIKNKEYKKLSKEEIYVKLNLNYE